ncbi:MAG: hypothetical protein ACRD4Q_15920, partial [Candidatus Acidiferrales bacterium]
GSPAIAQFYKAHGNLIVHSDLAQHGLAAFTVGALLTGSTASPAPSDGGRGKRRPYNLFSSFGASRSDMTD